MEVVIWDDKGTMIVRHPDPGPQKLAGASQVESDLYRFAGRERRGKPTCCPRRTERSRSDRFGEMTKLPLTASASAYSSRRYVRHAKYGAVAHMPCSALCRVH